MRLAALLSCLLTILLLASCRPSQPEQPSHIRIEPSRPAKGTPPGKPASGPATAQEMGIAFYPGAKTESSTLVRDDMGVTGVVLLSTRDSYASVVEHYRKRYERPFTKVVNLGNDQGQSMAFNWQTAHGNFTVTIKQDVRGHRTLIHLVRTPGVSASHKQPRT